MSSPPPTPISYAYDYILFSWGTLQPAFGHFWLKICGPWIIFWKPHQFDFWKTLEGCKFGSQSGQRLIIMCFMEKAIGEK